MGQSPYRKDFEYPPGQGYFNTGAEGLLLKTCARSFEDYLRAKGIGAEGRPQLYEKGQECKSGIARLLGVSAKEIAVVSNASEAINRLCNSIPWNPGRDEVVINDLEFPSNVLPWLRLQKRGVKVRIVRNRNWHVVPEDFEREINDNTRLVSVSHVSYMTGSRLDIQEIGRMAHSVGAIYSVDATQSLGRIPIPMECIDYLVASTYKWLISPHGGGVVFCSRDLLDSFEPEAVGWWSVADIFRADRFERYELKSDASRLELGMPGFPVLYGISDAVAYLNEVGISRIEQDLQPVSDFLIEEVSKLKVELMTPLPQTQRAGLVSFLHPDCMRIAEELSGEGIQVWGGDRRVRISVHLYNDRSEVETLVKLLREKVRL